MANTYECVYILTPDSSEEQIENTVSQASQIITDSGGALDELSRWGKRRLAYPIRKFRDGFYFCQKFSSGNEALQNLDKTFKLNDVVLRFLITRAEESPAEGAANV